MKSQDYLIVSRSVAVEVTRIFNKEIKNFKLSFSHTLCYHQSLSLSLVIFFK